MNANEKVKPATVKLLFHNYPTNYTITQKRAQMNQFPLQSDMEKKQQPTVSANLQAN